MLGKEKIITASVLTEVLKERERQHEKFGEQNWDCLAPYIQETYGEHGKSMMTKYYRVKSEREAKEVCDLRFKNGIGTWADILLEEVSEAISEYDIVKRRAEVIQIAAVAVAWAESIDRVLRENNTGKPIDTDCIQLDIITEAAKAMEVIKPTDANDVPI